MSQRAVRRTDQSRGRAGFTLLEVVLVVGMTIALLAGVVGVSSRVVEHRSRARSWASAQEASEHVIHRLERDLSTCLIGHREAGSGVLGSEQGIRIVSRGVSGLNGDHVVTEIRFDPSQRRMLGRRIGDASRPSIAGDEEPVDFEVQEQEMSVIGRGVESVRFMYRDESEWVLSYDSLARGRLPLAVQVEVWFEGGASKGVQTADGSPAGSPRRPPDRVRVFAIPDAGSEASLGLSGFEPGATP